MASVLPSMPKMAPRDSARTATRSASSKASCTSSSASTTRWSGILHGHSDFCHNCGIRLTGPYCSACGQKSVPLSLTFHDFLHEFTHEMFHVDGRLFQSVRRLLLSPGFLTREYVQGRRAQWISPIRLYL